MDAKVDIKTYMTQLGQQARAASRVLACATTAEKNAALLAMADAILADQPALLAANAKDMAVGKDKGLDAALLDRLELNEERILGMAEAFARSPPCLTRWAKLVI